ncbi:hypothetical protein [Arthrobacter sp. PM3]|uniref:hypothetical protein n=1 Tax=Arthrobacter sp. PM3 TaxID=2017685 RepID=UPI000E10528E|nr:hypothetical protein [Arthrobacter sp. PM3]AXJ10689.1 hypothetical protein CFN17_14510 [Arthrobacter sp. PM3]
MTEPNREPAQEHDHQPSPAFDQLPQQAHIEDPAISAVLDRLDDVRLTPVAGHGDVYAEIHDALLEALNEDVASPAGAARRIHAAGNGSGDAAREGGQ